jgi:hypothetical protein
MNYLLIKVAIDYVDEFDVQGFIVTTRKAWNKDLKLIKAFLDSDDCANTSFSFGEHYQVGFYTFWDFEAAVTTSEITEEEAKTLKKLFGEEDDELGYFYWGNGGDIVAKLVDTAEAWKKV